MLTNRTWHVLYSSPMIELTHQRKIRGTILKTIERKCQNFIVPPSGYSNVLTRRAMDLILSFPLSFQSTYCKTCIDPAKSALNFLCYFKTIFQWLVLMNVVQLDNTANSTCSCVFVICFIGIWQTCSAKYPTMILSNLILLTCQVFLLFLANL